MCDANGTIVNPQRCEFGCQIDRYDTCEANVGYCGQRCLRFGSISVALGVTL